MGRALVFNLLPYQTIFFKKPKKIMAFIGGTGTGKTFLLPRLLYTNIKKKNGGEWIVSAPTIPMLKRNPVKYIERFFKENDIKYEFNKTEMIMRVAGATIYFISAETSERMQGIHADGIYGDEAGLFPVDWYETALQRIGFEKGHLFLATTPYFHNWLKTEIWDKYIAGDKDILLQNPVSADNPFYPREEIERARLRLPDWKFKMFYEAKFTRPAGLIYEGFKTCKPFKIPNNWFKVRGLDFGFNNPSACIWLAQSPDGIWYAYKEFKRSGLTTSDLAKHIQDPTITTYADPASAGQIEELKRMGFDVRKADKDVLGGIAYIQSLTKEGKLIFFENLIKTIDELNTYQWETDKNGDFIDKPRKYNDHLLDSLRYALYTIREEGSGEVLFIESGISREYF